MAYNETEMELNIPKIVAWAVGIIVVVFLFAFFIGSNIHRNDIQEFTVVQTIGGKTFIRDQGGYYFSFFPKKWAYRKVNQVYFSNERDESKDQDGIVVRFKNKGTGDISSQVVYRLYNTPEEIMTMHQYVAGNQDRLDEYILAKLKDIVMEKASQITSSEAIEDREKLAAAIRKDIINNEYLMGIGIKIEQFSITQIKFDETTTALFEAQQKADLQKKTAEAEEANLQMQKKRTEAEYEQKIAESKGKAEVEKIKQVTDAEREAELARIQAEKEVTVAKLEKEQQLVKVSKEKEVALVQIAKEKEVAELQAQKEFTVAEIAKKTEGEQLEIIKLKAQEKVAEAEAKQKELELAKGISEQEKYRLDVEKETKIGIAKALAEGLKTMQLPRIVNLGGGVPGTGDVGESIKTFLDVKTLNALGDVK